MKLRRTSLVCGSSLLLLPVFAAAAPVGTAVTYQGNLEDGGGPVTNTSPGCDFEFTLWRDASSTMGEDQIGGVQSKTGVSVDGGVFTVDLDFGSGSFTGLARWLEISVCCPSSCTVELLSPRVELTPAPHALRALEGAGPPNAIEIDEASGKVAVGNTPDLAAGSVFQVFGGARVTDFIQSFGPINSGGTITVGGTSGVDGIMFPDGTLQTTAIQGLTSQQSCGVGLLDQEQSSIAFFIDAPSHSQSFVPGLSGCLTDAEFFELTGSSATMWEVTVTDDDSNVLATQSVGVSGSDGVVSVAFSSPPVLTAGMTYEFTLTGDSNILLVGDTGDPYSSGMSSSSNPDFDFMFRTFMSGGTTLIGINNSTPIEALDVLGNIHASGNLTSGNSITIDGTANTLNSSADIGLQTAGGRVGIGTDSPTAMLHIMEPSNLASGQAINVEGESDGVNPNIRFTEDGGLFVNIRLNESNGNAMELMTGSTARLIIDQAGNVGIGDLTPDVELDVVGDINYTGTIQDVSDERLKENIEKLQDALSKVRRLRGVYFNMKDTPERRDVGVIAQDVQEVLPEAVRIVDPDNGYLGVSYTMLIPLLVEAVKDVDAAVSAHDKRHEMELNELRERIGTLERAASGSLMRAGLPLLAVGLIGLAGLARRRRGGAGR